MRIWKSLLGLGAAAGAALFTLKVAKKYEDNRLIEADLAASGEEPAEAPKYGMFGDIVRAAGDVVSDMGGCVREALIGSDDDFADEEDEDVWEVYPDGVDVEEFTGEADEAAEEPAPEVPEEDLLSDVQKAVAQGLGEAEEPEKEQPAE